MKQKELLILKYLRTNARMSLTSISRKTHIPISTLYEVLKKAEGMLIKKYTAILDFSMLGYPLVAEILFRFENGDKERAEKFFKTSFNVNRVFKINNEFDFLVEGYFRDIKEADYFIGEVERRFKVRERKIFYVSHEVENEKFLTNTCY